MDRHYSTLELFQHDETARAPERDYDATAFELDTSALAPQVVPDSTPQVLYDSSFPEARGKTEDSTKERASTHHTTKAALKWLWMVVALLVAAAIAIGVGVGTWRHREHSSKKPSTHISPPAPQNHNITPAAGHILNDTSLAVVISPNGDRQLFFQDNTGSIRRAVRTASETRWSIVQLFNATTHLSNAKIPSPKKYTPLAITISDIGIQLCYVSKNHHLILTLPETMLLGPDPDLENYSTAVDTRSLSVASLSTPNQSTDTNSTTTYTILYYENPTGQVSALIRRFSPAYGVKWIDVTSQNSQSLPSDLRKDPAANLSYTLYESAPNDKFSPPFTTETGYYNDTFPDVQSTANFYSPLHDCILNTYYLRGVNDSGFLTPGYFDTGLVNITKPNQNNVAIRQSDIATFGEFSSYIWINGTQPVSDPDGPTPESSFPFRRLASVTSADGSTFLYHQINDTTFAEEHWDSSSGAWLTPDYITIPDS